MTSHRWSRVWTALLILALCALGPGTAAAASFPPFVDLGGVPWAVPAIVVVAAQGLMGPVQGDGFAPQEPVSAGTGLELLRRLLPGGDTADAQAVAEMPTAVPRAAGYGAALDVPLTRARWAAWLARGLRLRGSNWVRLLSSDGPEGQGTKS